MSFSFVVIFEKCCVLLNIAYVGSGHPSLPQGRPAPAAGLVPAAGAGAGCERCRSGMPIWAGVVLIAERPGHPGGDLGLRPVRAAAAVLRTFHWAGVVLLAERPGKCAVTCSGAAG